MLGMSGRLLITMFAFLCIGGSVCPTNAVAKDEPMNVRIIGAVLGGPVNRSYAAFAQAFMKEYPGANVDILPGGAVGNNTRIQKGAGEFGHTQTVLLKAAANGTEPFKQKHDKLRSMLRVGDECRLNFIARDAAPIRTFEELIEKKSPIVIGMSTKGSVSELFGKWLLDEYGITYDDIRKWGGKVDFSAYDSVANSMKDNQVDIVVWAGPGEPIFLQEVALGQKLRWIPLEKPEVIEAMKKRGLFQTVVKGSEFNGMVGMDVPVMSDTNELFCSVDVPEDVVYKIVKTWMENHKAIGEANPGWASFDPSRAAETTLELHPGAAKYYREIGLLK